MRILTHGKLISLYLVIEGGGSVSLSTNVRMTDKVSSTNLSMRDLEVGWKNIHLLEDSIPSIIAVLVPLEPRLQQKNYRPKRCATSRQYI